MSESDPLNLEFFGSLYDHRPFCFQLYISMFLLYNLLQNDDAVGLFLLIQSNHGPMVELIVRRQSVTAG